MARQGEELRSVEKLYDATSAALEELYGADLHFGYWDASVVDLPSAAARMTEHLIERTQVTPGQHVLDLGCGTGNPALRLARAREVRVTGVSVSRREVARANDSAEQQQMAHDVQFERVDALALPYTSASFDAAWAIESMSHMADRAVVLRELSRVLRPGGRLLIADGFLRRPPSSADSRAAETVCAAFRMGLPPTLPGHTELLGEAGFVVVDQEDLSEHAQRSITCLAHLMQARTAEFSDMFGEKAFTRLLDSLLGAELTGTIGYVLLSAERR